MTHDDAKRLAFVAFAAEPLAVDKGTIITFHILDEYLHPRQSACRPLDGNGPAYTYLATFLPHFGMLSTQHFQVKESVPLARRSLRTRLAPGLRVHRRQCNVLGRPGIIQRIEVERGKWCIGRRIRGNRHDR